MEDRVTRSVVTPPPTHHTPGCMCPSPAWRSERASGHTRHQARPVVTGTHPWPPHALCWSWNLSAQKQGRAEPHAEGIDKPWRSQRSSKAGFALVLNQCVSVSRLVHHDTLQKPQYLTACCHQLPVMQKAMQATLLRSRCQSTCSGPTPFPP